MSQKGREVLRGNLTHKRKGGSWKKRSVVAYCGLPLTTPAQLQVFEHYEKVQKPGQKPKCIITLLEAKIESNYTGLPPVAAYSTAVVSEAASLTSPSTTIGSPHSGSELISPQGSSSGVFSLTGIYKFIITTSNGDEHEFRTEGEHDRLRWVKLLQLLMMFPYTIIPEEPSSDPLKCSIPQDSLNPKQYNADSVWPVYILPEEVGTNCSIIGSNIVALKSGIPGVSIGRLDIFSPAQSTKPLVSWDRDKMRRTGKTGQLVFIEIGRRCQGGPGLLWMFTGFNKAHALRETLHNFLFQGDGKAVDIPIESDPVYDIPRASFDSLQDPSYRKQGSVSLSGSNRVLHRSRSLDQDSGCPGSPASFVNTSSPLEAPPVRLDRHPSIRRKNSTKPSDIKSSDGKESPSGSYTSARSVDSAIDAAFEQDESHSHSDSPSCERDGDGDVIGPMDPDASGMYYDDVLSISERRSHSLLEASCSTEYERMTHPKDSIRFMYDDYVFMRPRSVPPSLPIPVEETNTYDQLNHFPQRQSPQQRSVQRNDYDHLPLKSEREQANVEPEKPSQYENFPLPQYLQGASSQVYRPLYENVEKAMRDRRGSQNQEQYENVTATGEQVKSSQEANDSASKNGDKKRLSLRRKSSTKEQSKQSKGTAQGASGQEAKTPSPPPRVGVNDQCGYSVIQTDQGKSCKPHPTVKSVKYSCVNFPNTEAFHEIRAKRAERKAMARNES